ncbi:hypothetical protein JOC73_002541 [Alkaliphilus hydrothermalis]|uniref:Uncharacterized protein n=1 Tax=Alkaliphilus hydrothermalis TaxID=1482730 RepID=A0ABS2NSM7_9FIRM|nr:hypothetical protein [Alkaliphilus hydrothermalis]
MERYVILNFILQVINTLLIIFLFLLGYKLYKKIK